MRFQRGDLVWIAEDLGESMSHFESGVPAIVSHSYGGVYGNGRISENDQYQVVMMTGSVGNRVAWYYTEQLSWLGRASEEFMDLLFDARDAESRRRIEARIPREQRT